MALREFADSLGRTRKAWGTYPRAADGAANKESAFSRYLASRPTEEGVRPTMVRQPYQAGWLTFKSSDDLRRLVPIPADWETADDATLRTYLDLAEAHRKPE